MLVHVIIDFPDVPNRLPSEKKRKLLRNSQIDQIETVICAALLDDDLFELDTKRNMHLSFEVVCQNCETGVSLEGNQVLSRIENLRCKQMDSGIKESKQQLVTYEEFEGSRFEPRLQRMFLRSFKTLSSTQVHDAHDL